MQCKICDRICNDWVSIATHIRRSHNITSHEYYDKYLKEPNEGKCKICGIPTKFYVLSNGYRTYCSQKCKSNDPELKQKMNYPEIWIKVKNTLIKKYGVDNPQKIPACKEKTKRTCLKKYGVDNQFKRTKYIKKRKKQKYNDEYYTNRDKVRRGIADGTINPWKNHYNYKMIGRTENYKSKWEILFQILNPNCKYEKIRIPYIGSDDKSHTYFVDFVDEKNKILYEIKPDDMLKYRDFQLKKIGCRSMVFKP